MLLPLREYEEDGFLIKEYSKDGENISHIVKTLIVPESEQDMTQESLEQKIERLEKQRQEDNLMQLEVLASIYEELLMKG